MKNTGAVDGLSWRYHRLSQQGVSKWVLGNSWVTKWDKERFCRIGIAGEVVRDWKVARPKAARQAIEYVLSASSIGGEMTAPLTLASPDASPRASRRKCLCDLCTRISPMHDRLKEALPESLRDDLEYLMMRLMCAEEDRDVAEAKLHGNWPGWEWMIDARRKEEAVSPNKKLTDSRRG